MRIVVLGNEGSWYVADLARAARQRGHECDRADFGALMCSVGQRSSGSATAFVAGDVNLANADAVIIRTMPPGSLEQVMESGAGLLLAAKFALVILAIAAAAQRDFAHVPLLRSALASGADPAPALRAIARQDRVVLVLALVIVYLGLAVSRA